MNFNKVHKCKKPVQFLQQALKFLAPDFSPYFNLSNFPFRFTRFL